MTRHEPQGRRQTSEFAAAHKQFPAITLAVIASCLVLLQTSRAGAQSAAAGMTAAAGVTAISGRVDDAGGNGLPRVRVTDNSVTTYTDAAGQFLLSPVPPGQSVIQIDGRHAGGDGSTDYGFYEVRFVAASGRTSPLGFTSYLTPIDHAHDVAITSPTLGEVVVTTPMIPNLELHLAPGTVARDAEGKVVTHIGITQVPPDRQPFPGPPDPNQSLAFTIQPGAACLETAKGGVGYAWIIYPNYHHQLPRARESFMRYEPDLNGWRTYGAATVSKDGTQVIPDRNVVITDFESAECDPSTKSHPLIIKTPGGAVPQ
jgi:hypothetical protein